MKKFILAALVAAGLTPVVQAGAQSYPHPHYSNITIDNKDWSTFTRRATGTTTDRSLADAAKDTINVRDNGVAGDGVLLTGTGAPAVTLTSVSLSTPTHFTITGANFQSTDVGKLIFIGGAGAAGVDLVSTIATVTDTQHITTNDAASTALSNVGNNYLNSNQFNTVAYGTDDAAHITTLIQKYKALGGNASFVFPYGTYIIKANSLDFTQIQGMDFYGYGATFYGATNGVPVIDAWGMFGSQIRGFNVIGDRALPPNIGILYGRYLTGARAFGLNRVQDIGLFGYFSLTADYDMASETTIQDRISGNNSAQNAYGFIGDGINHFGVTSQYVTPNLPADTPFTFTLSACQSCRFVANASGSVAAWIAAPSGFDWSNGYLNSQLYGMVLYQTAVIRTTRLTFTGNVEGPPVDDFYFDGTGNTSVNGLSFHTGANIATGAVIGNNSSLTAIKLRDIDLHMDTLTGSSTLFANPSVFTAVTGDVYFGAPTPLPTLPPAASLGLQITLGDGEVLYFGTHYDSGTVFIASASAPTGTTQTMAAGTSGMVLENAALIAAQQVRLPLITGLPGQTAVISSVGGVTALDMRTSTAATIAGSPTSLAANSSHGFISDGTIWIPIR